MDTGKGMTLKQFAIANFFKTLEAYREATSAQIHAAKGNVPKRFWPLVNHVMREETGDHVTSH